MIGCFQLEGSDGWIMGNLEIDDWRKVHVGMPIRLRFRGETQGELADIESFVPDDA